MSIKKVGTFLCRILMALFIPPVSVFYSCELTYRTVDYTLCHTILAVILTICGFIPGVIMAFYYLIIELKDHGVKEIKSDPGLPSKTRKKKKQALIIFYFI